MPNKRAVHPQKLKVDHRSLQHVIDHVHSFTGQIGLLSVLRQSGRLPQLPKYNELG